MRQRPRGRRSRRDRHPHHQPKRREPPSNIFDQPVLAAEQMRHSADVEPQPVAVDLDQRRPSSRPAREPLDERRVALGVGRNRDQRGVERARVGQPSAGPRAPLGGGFGDRMDDRPVCPLDGEDDRRFRRGVGAPRPALHRQLRQPDGSDPLHERASIGPAELRARGIARHPTPAARGPAGRDRL